MKHFIATRFNLKTSDWKKSKSGNLVLTNEWLEHRFNLFEKYCFPSVRNQSNQNFTWCVFFDVNTPQNFKDKIVTFTANTSNVIPLFIDGMDNLNISFKKFISENITNSDSYIVTTRIDNDDIIHKDFVKIIQSLFQPSDLAVIDLRKGYQVSIDVAKPEVRLYTHPFNAFISVIENVKSFETVFSRTHYDWKTENNIILYKRKRLWMELSHQENYVNHRQINLKKAHHYNKVKFILRTDIEINILDVLQTNLKIYIKESVKYLKTKAYFVSKIPFRARRCFLNKIN